MPKKHNKRHLKGGFLDSLSKTFSNWGDSLKSNATSMWNKSKQNMGMGNSSYTPSSSSSYTPSPPSSYTQPSSSPYTQSMSMTSSDEPSQYSYGGSKKRRNKKTMRAKRTKRMRGGYKDNISLNNLASSAAPFSGATARAHNWVGGRKRRTMSRRK